MKNNNRWIALIILAIVAFQLTGCAQTAVSATPKEPPAIVEKIDGSEFNRVTLTEKAAKRLDVQTTSVKEEQIEGKARMVVPYSALIYGLKGETWLYTSPEARVFVRAVVTVDYIKDGKVVLLDGPPVGTEVATVAVAQLYGTDTGITK